MARRNLLHKSKLEDFKNWLEFDGWTLEDTKGFYEVLRASKCKRKFILFSRLELKEHYSVRDADEGVVAAYIRNKKKLRDADRNRANGEWMLDVENSDYGYDNVICSHCNASITMDEGERYPFCPICGAKMKVMDEEKEAKVKSDEVSQNSIS